MSIGLIFFTLADSTVQPNFSSYGKKWPLSPWFLCESLWGFLRLKFRRALLILCWRRTFVFFEGVALISLALCADAVIGNVQEKAMKRYNSSNSEMVTFCHQRNLLLVAVEGTGVCWQLKDRRIYCFCVSRFVPPGAVFVWYRICVHFLWTNSKWPVHPRFHFLPWRELIPTSSSFQKQCSCCFRFCPDNLQMFVGFSFSASNGNVWLRIFILTEWIFGRQCRTHSCKMLWSPRCSHRWSPFSWMLQTFLRSRRLGVCPCFGFFVASSNCFFFSFSVTTCRKALTIVLSFIFFAKPFTFQWVLKNRDRSTKILSMCRVLCVMHTTRFSCRYVWSGLIVVLGIYLNIYSKNQQAWNAKFADFHDRFVRRRRLIRVSAGSIVWSEGCAAFVMFQNVANCRFAWLNNQSSSIHWRVLRSFTLAWSPAKVSNADFGHSATVVTLKLSHTRAVLWRTSTCSAGKDRLLTVLRKVDYQKLLCWVLMVSKSWASQKVNAENGVLMGFVHMFCGETWMYFPCLVWCIRYFSRGSLFSAMFGFCCRFAQVFFDFFNYHLFEFVVTSAAAIKKLQTDKSVSLMVGSFRPVLKLSWKKVTRQVLCELKLPSQWYVRALFSVAEGTVQNFRLYRHKNIHLIVVIFRWFEMGCAIWAKSVRAKSKHL